jgi:aryl-alcohol dehydrogenase-like predicted oxidoreductase
MGYGQLEGVRLPVSRLVLGTFPFSPERQEEADALLDLFVAAGGTAIDTAPAYGWGDSERAIGAWLDKRRMRERVVVISKGAHPRAGQWEPRVTPAAIDEDLSASLDRLRLEAIDLYLLHRDDPSVPVGPLIEQLNQQLAAGRINAIGVSNWSHSRIAEANVYATRRGLRGLVASSPQFALAVPNQPIWPDCVSIAGDAEALTWYRATELAVMAWSAQAGGFFSGRFAPEACSDPYVARVYDRPDNWERLRRVQYVAKQWGCTASQVALSWVLHQSPRMFAIVGPRTVAELEDCLGAPRFTPAAQELSWLNLDQ